MVKKTLVQLKQEFLCEDFDVHEQALKRLARIKEDSVVNFFINNLKNADRRIQMSSAFALRIIANNRAIKPLLAAIKNPSNKQYTGSFVYALQTHNCKDLVIPILKIALNNNYENQTHALQILAKQRFKASQKEILQARKLIRRYINSENKCPDYAILIEELTGYIDLIEKDCLC
ncbi:MAG: HEAT repeat domain-containing protein [Candidatus Omnitrophica bacterium]|nr:HEAT repeat domain-containing protein [Candidatus Omnitrophota bacterium]